METTLQKFWNWYEAHQPKHVLFATSIFLLQIVHLYWLTVHVVSHRLIGVSLWDPSDILQYLIVFVDYTEIPAIVLTSAVYIGDLRKKFHWKSILYLILLNSQWLHLFWITDEYVVQEFTGATIVALPLWLLWGAIIIDYLEIPVMIDTGRRSFSIIRRSLSGKVQ